MFHIADGKEDAARPVSYAARAHGSTVSDGLG